MSLALLFQVTGPAALVRDSCLTGHSTTTITRDLYQHVRHQVHVDSAEKALELLPGERKPRERIMTGCVRPAVPARGGPGASLQVSGGRGIQPTVTLPPQWFQEHPRFTARRGY